MAGQADAGAQAACIGQTEIQRAAVSGHRPPGDGQPQTMASVGGLAGYPGEGLTEARQPLLGNPGTLIADFHLIITAGGLQPDHHFSSCRGKTQGIAQQIVHGAGQLVRPAVQNAAGGTFQPELPITGNETGILQDVGNQTVQFEGGGWDVPRIQPAEGQNIPDQTVKAATFAVQALPERIVRAQPLLLSQRQSDTQPRQRRAQLMGNVSHQLGLTVEQALHPVCHVLELARQLAYLVPAAPGPGQGSGIEAALGQILGGGAELAQGSRQVAAEQQTQCGQHQHGDGDIGQHGKGRALPAEEFGAGYVQQQLVGRLIGIPGQLEQAAIARSRGGGFVAGLAPGQGGQGALQQSLALVIEQLGAQTVLLQLLLQPLLRGSRTLLLIDANQLRAEIAQLRMELQQEPVLLQGAADQKARTTHQQGGQPENGEDLPEQPHGRGYSRCQLVSASRSAPRPWRRSCMCLRISSRRCSRSSCSLLRCSSVSTALTCSWRCSRRVRICSRCCWWMSRNCSCCCSVSCSSLAMRSIWRW